MPKTVRIMLRSEAIDSAKSHRAEAQKLEIAASALYERGMLCGSCINAKMRPRASSGESLQCQMFDGGALAQFLEVEPADGCALHRERTP